MDNQNKILKGLNGKNIFNRCERLINIIRLFLTCCRIM